MARLPKTGLVRVDILIDVRDAMGANILDTAAEHLRPLLEKATGGTALMGILTNAAAERRAGARFALPLELLTPAGCERGPGALDRGEVARRLVLAGELAQEDPRAR